MRIHKKFLRNVLSASLIALTIPAFATTYEDAEDKTTTGWVSYGDTTDATIRNVYDADKESRVIALKGNGRETGYQLGNTSGRGSDGRAWHNSSEKVLQWSMKYDEPFRIYIPITTEKGNRYLTYSNQSVDKQGKIRGGKVHHGLGEDSIDGTWHTFTRNLEADWNAFEPDNPFVSVNGFFIKGSGYIDDIIANKTNVAQPENLMHVTNSSGETKMIKILGTGSGGSHHLIFHHSDKKTVIECGDMGAMSISHDGGKTFQQLVSDVHAQDIDSSREHTLPRLFSILEHPTHPDWLLGVSNSGIISFSTDRGLTWHTKDMGGSISNKIVIRNEGNKIIAYYASGYKLGSVNTSYGTLGCWVDITDIPKNISTFHKNQQYGYIRYNKKNPTGLHKKYYGDMVRLGTADDNKLFVVGKGGIWVCEGDPKNDDDWKNITDSIFTYKAGVYPTDHAVSIGNKLYILAFGDNTDTMNTAGVYVHTRGDITNGKYNFTRITKGLNLQWFHTHYVDSKGNSVDERGNTFKRNSGALLEHKDTVDNKTYLYLFTQSVVYRLNITDGSDTFERVTNGATVDGVTYSKGYMLGKRNTTHWSRTDNGSYTPYDKAIIEGVDGVQTMPFGRSVNPTITGLNTVRSFDGKIYISNIIEVKVSDDNGKTFHSYTTKIANTGSVYDGKIKSYYGYMGLYEDGVFGSSHRLGTMPANDAVSFWWSTVKNRGMDNMVSTAVAINPNNPKEMVQTYMDYHAFFSDDAGDSWHYIAGGSGTLADMFWTQWINGSFYAQDRYGIYRLDKENLEFKKLKDTGSEYINMSIEEAVRVRKYYDKDSDTLVVAGTGSAGKYYNGILVFKHFTDDNLREVKIIKDARGSSAEGYYFYGWRGIFRSFKDVYCDGEYVYAINSELGIIKMPLNNLPENYNDSAFGLDEDEYAFSGLFDKAGNAIVVTGTINKKYENTTNPNIDDVYAEIVEDIAGNKNGILPTAAQINSLDGVSDAIDKREYSSAFVAAKIADDKLKAKEDYDEDKDSGKLNFQDANHPTSEEIQKIVHKRNKQIGDYYSVAYSHLGRLHNQSAKIKKIDIKDKKITTILEKNTGFDIDNKVGVAKDNMLTLLGIDPTDPNRILASISGSATVIESKDGGYAWSEFIPQISGNSQGNQMANAVFAPSDSPYDVIILGTGSAYGVLK